MFNCSFNYTMKRILLLITIFCLALFTAVNSSAQSVLDPNDAIVTYNSAAPPTQPAYGQIGKWVRTSRLSWSTTGFKCYIYKGVPFRLKFPKSWTSAADGKLYPVYLFFHGAGEAGTIYDNEFQLYHGGDVFNNATNAGTLDGFLIYPQSQDGSWGNGQYDIMAELIKIMSQQVKADLNRVSVNGLSAGGYASWEFTMRYPYLVASAQPMSAIATGYGTAANINLYKFTHIWYFQGGQDAAPAPYTANQVTASITAAGGNLTYTLYPDLGHGTWDRAWSETDFIPFMLRSNVLNPWALNGRYQFCTGDAINITVGIAPGFAAYQWRKDSTVISGATGNSINVTSLGSYSVRAKRSASDTAWTIWSPVPLNVSIKAPTVTPPISIPALASKVLPAPDGSTTVPMILPAGYATYSWQQLGSTNVISTNDTLIAGAGDYRASVTETYGCASSYSNAFHVVNANGAYGPDAITGLTVTSTSQTSLTLNWSDKANPTYNETNFEVYRTTASGQNYKLVAKVAADVTTFTDNGLSANTAYYYIVRPVNENGAAPVSAEATNSTQADKTAPTAPGTLTLKGSTVNSLGISWTAATDNIGVTAYDIYVNGAKAYSVDGGTLTDTIFGLSARQLYNVYVIARDAAGNNSPHSNQLTAATVNTGLSYKYYQGSWSTLPAFNTLTPVATGRSPQPVLDPRQQETNFAFLWQGFITIPTAGTYTFQTTSDDGSKFYFNKPYSDTATATVNNDGAHGSTAVNSATFTLQPGVYPIAASYFQAGGGYNFSLSWKSTAVGATNYTVIPAAYFGDTLTIPGTVPAAPSAVNANPVSFKKVTITWADNGNNETGFEIYRSNTGTGTYSIIGTVGANVTTFDDNTVNPSTLYYYKVRSLNKYGASAFNTQYDYTSLLPLNNNTTDLSYYNQTITPSATTYSTTAKEGTYSLSFNGSASAAIGGSSSGYLHTAYAAQTVSFWIRPTVTTSNRVIMDLGGSDNGLAVRINAGSLDAGIASNNTRYTVSTPFTNTTSWTHVAVVFANSALRLYVNGVQAASTTTSFSSVGTTTNNSRFGSTNGTNAFNSTGSGYSGLLDYIAIINQGLSQAEIGQLTAFTLPVPAATTPALPSAPGAPTSLVAAGSSPSTVALSWTNNGATANNIEIARATGTSTNFVTVKTIAGNATSYVDSSLFANQQYQYKIRAIGDGGTSAYSATKTATTLNTLPVVQPIANQSVRYDVVTKIPVVASDADGDALTYNSINLPSFITLVPNGNGYALNIAPNAGLQGTYNNLQFVVADTHNGKDTISFNLVVNDNYSPVLAAISSVTLDEGTTQQFTASATDQNAGDTLSWSGINLPAFVTLVPNGNSVTVNLKPGFADAGAYNLQLQVADGKGGISTQSFTVTVNDKNPNYKFYVRFKYNTDAPAPWNNVTGTSTSNLKNDAGVSTNVGFSILNPTYQTWYEGTSTGSNSGIYPDVVLREYYFFGSYPGIFNAGNSSDMKLTGLDLNRKYSFKFFAGSNWSVQSDNGTTIFTINGVSKPIAVQGNTSNTVNFDNISPDSTGTITFNASVPSGTLVGYLNAFEVNAILDDGTTPAAPKSLTAVQQNGVAQLAWTNTAYNATGTEIARSSDSLGTYATIAVLTSASISSYNDSTIHGNHNYYYKVRAVNSVGSSAYSNIAGIVVPNKAPTMDSIATVAVKAGAFAQTTVVSHPDGSNTVVLTATGVPSFGTFTDNGNGTGGFNFSPTADNLGTYPITVTATDNAGGTVTRTFNVAVGDLNTTSTYFNFNSSVSAGAPWNTITGFPYGGTKTSNATDENGGNSGITMAFTENWENSSSNNGMSTYENNGVYPDKVMAGSFYEGSATTHTVNLTGLDNTKRYNLVFFNSVNFGVNAKTNFAANGTTVTIDPAYNTSRTKQINGLKPDASGKISFTMSKVSGANYAYLNALVVEAYDSSITLLNPLALTATAAGADKINLTWNDRTNNESGYQIWRAISGGSYALVYTTGINATNYTDSSLSANVKYYYKVRAASGSSTFSTFSNTASATTLGLNIFVNFEQSFPGLAPWNNTNMSPQVGTIFTSMKDAAGAPTGVGLNVQENFDGIYGAGVNTGNNSGIYSDNVLRENFGVFPGRHASYNITGLNQTLLYDLVFFASSNEYGDITTKYTVNKQRVSYLNASLNTNGTVTIHNVAPDATGNIHIDIDPGTTTSEYGLVAAMVIQGHLDPAKQNEAGPANTVIPGMARVAAVAPVVLTNENDTKNAFGDGRVYPNPFTSYINVDVTVKASTDVLISIFDLQGRLLYTERRTDIGGGNNTLRINTGNFISAPGMYLLRLSNANGESKVFKLIKQ